MKFNCLIILLFIGHLNFAQNRAFPFSKNHLGEAISFSDRNEFDLSNFNLHTKEGNTIAIDRLTITNSGLSVFYQRTVPFHSRSEKWVNQFGISVVLSGTIEGYARSSIDEKYTIDTLTFQNSGTQIPVDSLVKNVRISSLNADFSQFGLTYNITKFHHERWIFSFGANFYYYAISVNSARVDEHREINYSPSVKPSEIIVGSSDEYDVRLKSQLFNWSLPVSAMILVNNPYRNRDEGRFLNRIYGDIPCYFGFQLNPNYMFGKLNNVSLSKFNVNLGLLFVLGLEHQKSEKKKAYEAAKRRRERRE